MSLVKTGDLEKTRAGGLLSEHAAFYVANVLVILGALWKSMWHFGITSLRTLLWTVRAFKSIRLRRTACWWRGDHQYHGRHGVAPEVIMSKGTARGRYLGFGDLVLRAHDLQTPFEHANSALIYQNIGVQDVLSMAFTSGFNSDAKDFIQAAGQSTYEARMLRNGLSDVWAHPYLRDFDERTLGKSIKPPFKPPDAEHSAMSRCDLQDIMIGSFDTDIVPEYNGDFSFVDSSFLANEE